MKVAIVSRCLRTVLIGVGLVSVAGGLTACVSTSRATARALDDTHPLYASDECQDAIEAASIHQDLYTGRMILTPVLVVLTAGAAAPLMMGSNVLLDAADRVDASDLSEECGGDGRSTGEIAAAVAGHAALGAATGAALNGVAGGGGLAARVSNGLFGGSR